MVDGLFVMSGDGEYSIFWVGRESQSESIPHVRARIIFRGVGEWDNRVK
jgi:hypothetical protein